MNVGGTVNVIDACVETGVGGLVYTSTNNVVLGPPVEGASSATPYPTWHPDLYSTTKAIAERKVLAANGRHGLATCAIRPGGATPVPG